MHGINLYTKHGHVCDNDLVYREKNAPSTTPLALQDLIEKVMLLKKAVEKERKIYSTPGGSNVSRKLGEYSSLLASQGCIDTALGYLKHDTADQVCTAVQRVCFDSKLTYNCFTG